MTTPGKAQQPQRLYLDKSTPEDFINAKKMDWIYLVGDITTDYELSFVHKFGEALKSRPHTLAPDNVWSADPKKGCEPCKNTECDYCAMRTENIKQHDAAIARAATLKMRNNLVEKLIERHKKNNERPLLLVQIFEEIKSLQQQQE
jgi:hypothetical protein